MNVLRRWKKLCIAVGIFTAAFNSFGNIISAHAAVSIYGTVDLGIVSEMGSQAGSKVSLTSGNQTATRLGFKGSDKLGDNLTGMFVFETSIVADKGGFPQVGIGFDRQSFL